FVRADHAAGRFRHGLVDRLIDSDDRRRFQEARLPFVGAEQDLDALEQTGIGPAGLAEVFRATIWRSNLSGDAEDRLFIEDDAGGKFSSVVGVHSLILALTCTLQVAVCGQVPEPFGGAWAHGGATSESLCA